MKVEAIWIFGIFLSFALLEMWRTKFWNKPAQTRTDALVELIGSPVLLLITQPLILYTS